MRNIFLWPMIRAMKIMINHSFCFKNLKMLLNTKETLKHVWPNAEFPFQAKEWEKWFLESGKEAKSFYLYEEEPHNVIGHFALKYNNLISNNLYLCFVVIKPELRGSGLIEKVIKIAQDIAFLVYKEEDLYLHVRLNNPRALGAYQKHGFEILKKHSNIVRMIRTQKSHKLQRNDNGPLRSFS